MHLHNQYMHPSSYMLSYTITFVKSFYELSTVISYLLVKCTKKICRFIMSQQIFYTDIWDKGYRSTLFVTIIINCVGIQHSFYDNIRDYHKQVKGLLKPFLNLQIHFSSLFTALLKKRFNRCYCNVCVAV